MNAGQVLAGIPLKSPLPPELAASPVQGLEYDSRRVRPGFLFFAFPGSRADGRDFARDALERGALAVLSESEPLPGFSGSWVQVEHGRRALAIAARNYFQPRAALTGITGTNGKTTTAFLVDSVLRAAGKITALTGTVEYRLAGRVLPAVNTTPESVDLYRILAELDELGGTHATMEVSSHALALGRVHGFRFHTAIFTNLTRDHLDFHHTMEDYFAAKALLFSGNGADPPPCAAINRDDPRGAGLKLSPRTQPYWYGLGKDATVRARHISSGVQGLRFHVQHERGDFQVESPLIGRMNVYNILAACCAGLSYGIPEDVIARGIAACRAVPGRFERVDEGQPFTVVVDYAHTDDALGNAITVARGLAPKRVITVFGCGGDRDRSKRPVMGKVAAQMSDYVVLTSDNPRSEDPLDIMNDVLVGLRRHDTPYLIEPDRASAIRRAIEEARPGDLVLIAGKGHETRQVLKDRTIAFDDREVATEVLRGFGYHK